eukprot:6374779-Prymnesium_polylepis.1
MDKLQLVDVVPLLEAAHEALPVVPAGTPPAEVARVAVLKKRRSRQRADVGRAVLRHRSRPGCVSLTLVRGKSPRAT